LGYWRDAGALKIGPKGAIVYILPPLSLLSFFYGAFRRRWQVVVENVKYFEFEYSGFFHGLMSLGMERSVRVSEILPEYRR
jgi:hypothetical protein